MESNLNLYRTVYNAIFPPYSGRYRLTGEPNTTAFLKHTPQVHILHSHIWSVSLPRVLLLCLGILLICFSWRGAVTQCMCPAGFWSRMVSLRAAGLCRPSSPDPRGTPVAVKGSFISKGSGYKNLTSLEKYPQFRCGPQSLCFFDLSVRTRMKILERDILYQRTVFL